MTTKHEPTAEFQQFLEWQVASAMRRQDRFTSPARTGYRRYLAVAALVVISMMVGGAGVAASARIQTNQQRNLLVEQMRGELQLAEMRLEIARTTLEDARRRVEVGVADEASARTAERDLRLATGELERLQLNIEEVRQSGQPVQDDVTSPLVGGRDFVSQRLAIVQASRAVVAEAAMTAVGAERRRHEVGLSSEVALLEAETEAVLAVNEVQLIQATLSLRQRFLGGELTAEDATRQRLLLVARSELQAAERSMNLASSRYELLNRQFAAGLVQEMQVLEARLEMLTVQQDVTTLRNRIEMLGRGGR